MANILQKEAATKENRIWVRITAACNVKCVFCLDSDAQNGQLIDDAKIRDEIKNGYKSGTYNRIIISWGEASIHPKFHEYIRYAKEIGYDRVQTVTNGNMFSREACCQKVIEAWLDKVTFTIHGHTAKLHDYFTAAPGSYEKALKWLLILKKFHPQVILNLDIVVNKINVVYLPKMIGFFMRLWIYEFDVLQIIPFWRGFNEHKDQLFYKIEDYLSELHETWKFSKIPWVYMWTNRFPVEAFEGYEDLIQDPRKIKSEVMGEAIEDFREFIDSHGEQKPHCYGEKCQYCFLHQYCHDYLKHRDDVSTIDGEKYILSKDHLVPKKEKYVVLRWEEFPSTVYETYGKTGEDFIKVLQSLTLEASQELVNVPRCIRSENNNGLYEWVSDFPQLSVESYTSEYIKNFYRKKSTRCTTCKYTKECEWIHINFIRSYGFQILKPIKNG